MLEKEISFDVDMSNLRCGTNLAIHFSDMEKAVGYCDGQCARDLKWVNGKSNGEGWVPNKADPYDNSGTGDMGACCAVMDLWEANEECGSRDGDRFIAPTDCDG